MRPSCTIILPCYNEEARIGSSLNELWQYLSTHSERAWTLVCVDDGSTDGTRLIVETFDTEKRSSSHLSFQYVRLEENQGKGAAIQAGVRASDTDFYGFMDADLSIAYQGIIPQILETLATQDIVIGVRDTLAGRGYTGLRQIGSKVLGLCSRFLLGLRYRDAQCGFKWFQKKVTPLILSVSQPRFSFDVEFLARATQQSLSVEEVPVSWEHTGTSTVRLRDAIRYFLDVLLVSDSTRSRRWWTVSYVIGAGVLSFLLYGILMWKGYFFSDDFTWLWYGKDIVEGKK